MGKKTNNILVNLALLCAAILITLVLAEVVLRIFYPQNLNITKLDEKRLFTLKPGIDTILERDEFSTHVHISSQGLRDREYPLEKPVDTTRIAMVGDSFTFGFGVELNESLPKRAEQKLRDSGYMAEVMNFGVSAYGTEQEYLTIRDEVASFAPDIIILNFLGATDIKENVKYGLFDIENGTLVQNPQRDISFSLRARNFISWHSHLYSLFFFAAIDNSALTKALIRLGIMNAPLYDPAADFERLIYSREQSPEFSYSMNKTIQLITAAHEEARGMDAKFLVVIIPSKEQVDEGKKSEFLARKGLNSEEVDMMKVNRMLSLALKENSIDHIDLSSEFRAKNTNNSFYFDVDGHWNPKGNDLAADLVSKRIGLMMRAEGR